MGLHIKKNDETGEIFVSNIGLFLKIFRRGVWSIVYRPYRLTPIESFRNRAELTGPELNGPKLKQ